MGMVADRLAIVGHKISESL